MEKREELPFLVKRSIVQRLARFDTPSEVVKAVKEDFGLDLTRQRVSYYDPGTKAGAALDPDLKALFDETRKAFLEELDTIPIANKAVRLRHLQKQLEFFSGKNAAGIVMALCEAAAKEVGGAFTNKLKHEHTGKDGGPIRTVATIVPDNLEALSEDELLRLYRDAAASSPRVGPEPGPTTH
jgi:hypothetical protein